MSMDCLLSNSIYKGMRSSKTFEKLNVNTLKTESLTAKIVNFGNGSFFISPRGSQNLIISIGVNNDKEVVNLDIDIDTSMSEIGDKLSLIVIVSNQVADDTQPDVNLTLSDKFYLIRCGETEIQFPINLSYSSRNIFNFMFDGDKYVNTKDNC